jgi:hypothetical protein
MSIYTTFLNNMKHRDQTNRSLGHSSRTYQERPIKQSVRGIGIDNYSEKKVTSSRTGYTRSIDAVDRADSRSSA